MIRRTWQGAALALLLLVGGLWSIAFTSPWWSRATPGDSSGLTVAAAQRDGWLVMLMISRSGMVRVRHFEENLTHDQAITVRASQPLLPYSRNRPAGVFTAQKNSDGLSTSLWFHLFIPLIVAAGLVTWVIILPWLTRRWRIKQCRCVKCGYDLRKATSTACTECGHANAHVGAAA